MDNEGIRRKLAAMLSADVKDYSRLLSQDRVGTIKILNGHCEMLANFAQQCNGRKDLRFFQSDTKWFHHILIDGA